MADRFAIADIEGALRAREHPTVTVWNRLEGRPRTIAFERSLKAEVRDALWMLTRQWQVGEFAGEDAGSPITTRFSLGDDAAHRLPPRRAGAGRAVAGRVPLEAKRRAPAHRLRTAAGARSRSTCGSSLGRHWLKLIADLAVEYRQEYIDAYPVELPDPADPADADRCAHPEAWQALRRRGRARGGRLRLLHVPDRRTPRTTRGTASPSRPATPDDRGPRRRASSPGCSARSRRPGTRRRRLDPGAARVPLRVLGGRRRRARSVYRRRGVLPRAPGLARLRGDGAASAGRRPRRRAGAGHPRPCSPAPVEVRGHAEPALVGVRGPAHELRRTSTPTTTDLGKLLFLEFGLVYSNDWFVIPATLRRRRRLDRARRRRHQRLRRAHLDRARGRGRRRRLAALDDVHARRRASTPTRRPTRPAGAADGGRRSRRASRSRTCC